MKRKLILILLASIMASGMIFVGCDLFEKGIDGSGAAETYEPLIIRGKAPTGEDVEIEISTTRTVPRVVLTPMNNDTFVMRLLNGVVILRGTIQVDATHIIFYPIGDKPFTGDYTNGASYITLHEMPDGNGNLGPSGPSGTPSGPSGTPSGPSGTPGGGSNEPGPESPSDFAKELADKINAIHKGGASAVDAVVTLTEDTELEASLEIPAEVTLEIPPGKTLTSHGPNYPDKSDPDSSNPGSGSYQITGDGTLIVKGELVARNRTIRVKTEILSTGTYKLLFWGSDGLEGWEEPDDAGFVTVELVGDSGAIKLSDNAELTVTWNTDNSSYHFLLVRGKATVQTDKQFPLYYADTADIADGAELFIARKGTVMINKDSVLTINQGGKITGDGGNMKLDGTLIVSSGVTLKIGTDVAIASDSTGILEVSGILIAAQIAADVPSGVSTDAALVFKQGAAFKAGPWNVISAQGDGGMYSVVESNAAIEMKITEYPAYSFTFKGGEIKTRTLDEGATGNDSKELLQQYVFMQMPHIVDTDATLTIPNGAFVVVIGGEEGIKTGESAFAGNKGSLTVKGALNVSGDLSVDGDTAFITIPSTVVTDDLKIGYLMVTDDDELSTDTNDVKWVSDENDSKTLKGKQ